MEMNALRYFSDAFLIWLASFFSLQNNNNNKKLCLCKIIFAYYYG